MPKPTRTLTLCCLLSFALLGCDTDETTMDSGAEVDASVEDAGMNCPVDVSPEEPLPEPEVYTPRWAFTPWISKDISDRDDSYAFVQGFQDRDIPVGVLVIDSPWDENYTTFRPNPTRYPDFGGMVEDMHAMDVRVVVWTTQMVNQMSFDLEAGGDRYRGPSSSYTEGQACGFLANNGALYDWWKGRGSGVDFFNPSALAWWHRLQDNLLDMQIDGWKLDFGESYMSEDDPLMTFTGPVSHQAYSEEYYRDFLAYGRMRRGRDFLTMVRPYDASYEHLGRFHARPEHCPVGWVGDNHRDWSGLIDALDHIFRSVLEGYVMVGADIGGYLDRDQNNLTQVIPFEIETFQRWVAMGAMTPFMQLHGRGNLSPWTVPEQVDETIESYRYWATLHQEMVDFWYSLTQEAYANNDVILHPVNRNETDWANDWRYVVGDEILVAPITAPGNQRDIELPSGVRYFDWWNPARDAYEGGTTISNYDVTETGRIPLFVREGAIIPVAVQNAYTGLGSAASRDHLTVLAWPSTTETNFRLHESDDMITTLTSQRTVTNTQITLSRRTQPVILRVRHEGTAPTAVNTSDGSLTEVADHAAFEAADVTGNAGSYEFDAGLRWLWIKIPAGEAALTITITPGT